MIDIRDIQKGDLEYIADNMRVMDQIECGAVGLTPLQALSLSVADSRAHTFAFKGIPIGAYGTKALTDNGAVMWLLGTDVISNHKKDFMKQSREVIESQLSIYAYLTNSVYVEHIESIKWLTWLGARFSQTVIYNGLEFKKFEIRR